MATVPATSTGRATLRVADEPRAEPRSLDGEFNIGRAEGNDLVLDDPSVSREHARVVRQPAGYFVEDRGSSTGTFVERKDEVRPVEGALPLETGDVVRVGRFRLLFNDGAPARVDPTHAQPWSAEIHVPTVLAGFSIFFAGFLLPALVSPFANDIARDIGSPGVATLLPIVVVAAGAVARLAIGFLTDARGPYLPGLLTLGIGLLPLIAVYALGSSPLVVWPAVALLGIGFACLPVAFPMTSRRTAPTRRGLAIGIVSAGSVGTVVAALSKVFLSDLGWRNLFGLAIVPVVIALAIFAWGGRGSWTPPPPGAWRTSASTPGFRAVALFYGVSFGGFIGLYAFLPTMLTNADLKYQLSPRDAALVVAIGALVGGVARPVGGSLADRFGPLRVLPYVIAGAAALLVVAGGIPVLAALVVFILAMTLFEAGTGASFKLASQRFGAAVGAGAGLVGAAGGLIGFLLPMGLRELLRLSGSPALAFGALAAVPAGVATWLFLSSRLQREAVARPAEPAAPHLQRLDPFGRPVEFVEIGRGLTIGRATGNRLVLADDDLASRNHAVIEEVDGKLAIRDLRSTNGTMLWRDNQWRSVETEPLEHGDIIVIGANLFRYASVGGAKG